MGLFGGIETASVSGGGQYFLPGLYKVKLKAVKAQTSRLNGRPLFIIETVILESDNPSRKVGSTASQIIKMGELMSLPNIKGFLAGIVGADPTADDLNELIIEQFKEATGASMSLEDICEYVSSSDNPLADTELRLECVNVKTKKGTDFTKHTWSAAR